MNNVIQLRPDPDPKDEINQRVLDFRLEALMLLEAYEDVSKEDLISELTGLQIIVETGLHRLPK